MFEPVNNLEKSLMSAATNPSSRPQFYRDLLEADIFIIQSGKNNFNIQNNVLQQGSELKIQHIEKEMVNLGCLSSHLCNDYSNSFAQKISLR